MLKKRKECKKWFYNTRRDLDEGNYLFLITVKIPQANAQFQTLIFRVLDYQNKENRFTFYDTKTGYLKDFPSEWCSAEEVKE